MTSVASVLRDVIDLEGRRWLVREYDGEIGVRLVIVDESGREFERYTRASWSDLPRTRLWDFLDPARRRAKFARLVDADRGDLIREVALADRRYHRLVNREDESGVSPLLRAVGSQRRSAVVALVELGAKIARRHSNYPRLKSPLELAVREGDVEMTRLLLATPTRITRVSLERLAAQACSQAGDDFQRAEWERLFVEGMRRAR